MKLLDPYDMRLNSYNDNITKLCPFESWLKMYKGQERRAIN